MLKIKDNVDLKELEKFGFRYIRDYPAHNDYYQIDFDLFDASINVYLKSKYIVVYVWTEYSETTDKVITKLFDLIQAGLVEKVEV